MIKLFITLNLFMNLTMGENTDSLFSEKIYPNIISLKKEYNKTKTSFAYHQINESQINDFIQKSDKPWKVIYYYSVNHDKSKERLEHLMPIWNKNKDIVDVFIISAPNKKDYNEFINTTKNLVYPIFILDNNNYKNNDKIHEYNRILEFSEKIDNNKKINLNNISFGTFIYYDQEGNIKISDSLFEEREISDEKIADFTETVFNVTKYLKNMNIKN